MRQPLSSDIEDVLSHRIAEVGCRLDCRLYGQRVLGWSRPLLSMMVVRRAIGPIEGQQLSEYLRSAHQARKNEEIMVLVGQGNMEQMLGFRLTWNRIGNGVVSDHHEG